MTLVLQTTLRQITTEVVHSGWDINYVHCEKNPASEQLGVRVRVVVDNEVWVITIVVVVPMNSLAWLALAGWISRAMDDSTS